MDAQDLRAIIGIGIGIEGKWTRKTTDPQRHSPSGRAIIGIGIERKTTAKNHT